MITAHDILMWPTLFLGRVGRDIREDQGGWILYGQSDPIPGDPWNLAHRFLEEYMQIRNFSEDEDNTEESTKKLLEEADEFYYAAEYLIWFADGFVDLLRSARTA